MARNQIKDFTIFSVELGWAGVKCIFTVALFKLKVSLWFCVLLAMGHGTMGQCDFISFALLSCTFFSALEPSNYQGSRCT